LPLSSTQNLSTIDPGLSPNFGRYALPSLCERHSRVEFCPTHIPLAQAGLWPSSSYALTVYRATRSALQVEPPNALRAREEVHRHFSSSICYVDRRKLGREKDGYMRRKAQFWCTRRAGRGRKSIGPRSGSSVRHPRVEKSAFQEICERFLSINRTLFGLHRVRYNDAYLRLHVQVVRDFPSKARPK
jgi:hypothetical protein